MNAAKPGDKVKVHYTGTLDDGSEFESSEGRDPLELTLGEGQIIPAFEESLIGMAPGDSKTVTIPSREAYGERREEMIQEVDRERIPPEVEVKPGVQLRAAGPDGQSFVLTVLDASESTVTLDANHPLAGRDLTFDIRLVEIV